jgi:hypothetical protein
MSAKDSARIFAERNGITTAPEIARMEPQQPDDPTSVEILTWSARGKPISRLYTVHGDGHVSQARKMMGSPADRATTRRSARPKDAVANTPAI